jgi:hypothetical protein
MSFKITATDQTRFATRKEAEACLLTLASLCECDLVFQIVECSDPVSYPAIIHLDDDKEGD